MGQLISYRGAGWRGRTTLTTNDRGDRRLVRILNGYVSTDGAEIRSFPGWRTLVDLSEENNPDGGYSRYVIDAMRPVMEDASPSEFYVRQYQGGTDDQQTLYARAKPIWWEAFEQVGDTLNIMGTTRFREVPIYDTSRNLLTPVSFETGPDGKCVITMSGSPGTRTDTDATGASLNGLNLHEAVYCEGLTVDDPAVQDELDATINGRVHLVAQVATVNVTLHTQFASPFTASTTALTGGSMHKVRYNPAATYPTPTGADPFDDDIDLRIDDWNALTNWRIVPTLPLSIANAASHVCQPAWVANRQRDFGDSAFASVFNASPWYEGIRPTPAATFHGGVSRREQRELPYRIVPEPAGDRIIIAAPGYNCLFQVPLQIPFNPNGWPGSPSNTSLGIPWFCNDIYDKPRALGVPKCRLIDSTYTPAMASPSEDGVWNHVLGFTSTSPQFGMPPGPYRLQCTYEDEVTGEEGEPSEIIEFTVPSNDYGYFIQLSYFHPGYIMPECLALRLNVYMTAPGGEVLGFYKSFDLKHYLANPTTNGLLGYALQNTDQKQYLSGKYGFPPSSRPDDFVNCAEWRTIWLPLPVRQLELSPSSGQFDLGIDFNRVPLQVGMPRGASCARWIRGHMIAVGHIGNAGPNNALYSQRGTVLLDSATAGTNNQPNELIIGVHGNNNYLAYSDGDKDSGFGLAGRAFPDSCQGIEALSVDLLPGNISRFFQIDRVLNRRMPSASDNSLNSTSYLEAARERLRTTRDIVNLDFATSPADPSYVGLVRNNRSYYLKMFRGQLQVSDPGQPHRVVKAGGIGIKLLDPNKDDDLVSVFQLAGNAVLCSRKETYFFSWARTPGGEEPTTVSTEFGCIAPNSMVEFDGGVAWISERGPVALGATLQFVGADVQQDFVGQSRRYITDDEGMMRHTWACHDSGRGIVMWGMVTSDASHQFSNGRGASIVPAQADSGVLSRCPCDEVLIWSYRNNSFSTWRPPAGLEVLWMRQIVGRHPVADNTSTLLVAFLAADGRIYALDDLWSDCNSTALTCFPSEKAVSSTSLTTALTTWKTDGVANGGPTARSTSRADVVGGFLVRPGHIVQGIEEDVVVWQTTVESADQATQTLVLAEAQSWTTATTIKIGVRPAMTIETTYIGAEITEAVNATSVQMRYELHGQAGGTAFADVDVLKTDYDQDESPREVSMTDGKTLSIGSIPSTSSGTRHGRRKKFNRGEATGPEMAVQITISGDPQIRISDLSLEVG